MPIRRARLAAVVFAAMGLLAAVRSGSADTADTTLNIDYFACYSLGQGRMECEGSVSGGTRPYTYTFTPTERFFYEGVDYVTMMGYCTQNKWSSQTMTVRDATGATDSFTAWFNCGAPV